MELGGGVWLGMGIRLRYVQGMNAVEAVSRSLWGVYSMGLLAC